MKFLKQTFLLAIGAVAVAYEETSKVVVEQRKKFDKRRGKEAPKAA